MVVLQLCCWKFSHKETKKQESLFEPRFGGLSGNYTLRLQLVGKPVINFLFVIIELFSLSLTAEISEILVINIFRHV